MKPYIIILLFIVTLVSLAFGIDGYGIRRHTAQKYDAIIVAGCLVKKDGTPSFPRPGKNGA